MLKCSRPTLLGFRLKELIKRLHDLVQKNNDAFIALTDGAFGKTGVAGNRTQNLLHSVMLRRAVLRRCHTTRPQPHLIEDFPSFTNMFFTRMPNSCVSDRRRFRLWSYDNLFAYIRYSSDKLEIGYRFKLFAISGSNYRSILLAATFLPRHLHAATKTPLSDPPDSFKHSGCRLETTLMIRSTSSRYFTS
jgi:hypothetical protein